MRYSRCYRAPKLAIAQFPRGHARLNAFATGQLFAERIEFDCGAAHYAEHSSVGLSDERFECNAVDGRDCVVVD